MIYEFYTVYNRVNYTRMSNLEGVDSHIVTLDIEGMSDIEKLNPDYG